MQPSCLAAVYAENHFIYHWNAASFGAQHVQHYKAHLATWFLDKVLIYLFIYSFYTWCSPESQLCPGLLQKQRGSESREVMLLLPSALCVQLWGPLPRGGHGDEHRDGTPFLKERQGELGLLILEKRRLQGNLTVAFQHLKGACRKDGESGVTGQGNGSQRKRVGLD